METIIATKELVPDGEVLPVGAKAGPWIVEYELGRGGMGAVYAVVHDEIGKRAALKVVHTQLLGTGFNADRMLLEAKVVNQVDHPNIVDIFDTGWLAGGRPYIVMERLEGQSLGQRIRHGALPPDQVIEILLQIAAALIAAHAAGIVHRDLKPDNVFLIDNPDDLGAPRVKVLDWGIAKDIIHDVGHTAEGSLVGTPQYLSPEQARGDPVSTQTDVYSLGVMAYELFVEEPPFMAETAAEIMTMHLRATPRPASALWPDIPPALEQLVHAMLEKSSDRRPSMVVVSRALEAVRAILERSRGAVATPRSTTAAPAASARSRSLGRPTGTATPAVEWHSPRRWQWAVGAFAILATTAMVLVSRAGDRPTPPGADVELVPAVEAPCAVTPRSERTARVEVRTPAPEIIVRQSVQPAARPSRKVSPLPRRAAPRSTVGPRALDPDGTLEPYR